MHVIDHYDAEEIRRLNTSGEFFWLDLDSPTDEQLTELGEILGLPPLAIEDSQEFQQRAKIDDYGDRLLIVFYGAQPSARGYDAVEVHVHLTHGRIVTVHRGRCEALEGLRAVHAHSDHEIVYRILDALSESVLTMLRDSFSATGLKTLAIDRIAVFRQENADSRFLIVKHWPLCSNA